MAHLITKIFFVVCITGSTLLIFLYSQRDGFFLDAINSANISATLEPNLRNIRHGFEVYTSGCQIPAFDPFDPSIRMLYSSPGKLECTGPHPLVISNRTHLIVNMSSYVNQNIQCGYKKIWRVDEGKSDQKYRMDNTRQFNGSIRIRDDFVFVKCMNKKKNVDFEDFFAFIQEKPEIEQHCTHNFNTWVKDTKDTIQERLNVIIIGIDSVSRLNMLRHLPRTYDYLQNILGAIDLHGYTKVADNTFVNVVPLLSGLFVKECWNETMKSESFNYLDLIWKEFSKRGYRTLYGEDVPDIATFNYLKAGFFNQPTDYYLRPFTMAIKQSSMFMKSKKNCFNRRLEAEVYLNWVLDYVNTFKSKPIFAYLFNSRITHDNLNNVGLADDPYYNFLHKFHQSGALNNSILIFFSDHGIRFGKIRDTFIGKLEERMPFMTITLPPWFQNKYPYLWKNLKINEHRLTTPFDIYQTLQHLLNFTGQENIPRKRRGISLFSVINENRTCEDANILPHWCTCHVRRSVSLTDNRVIQSANYLIDTINDRLLLETQNCAELRIIKIIDARISEISDNLLKFKASLKDVIGQQVIYGPRTSGLTDYLVTILVNPGGGLIEGTIRYSEVTGVYQVMEDISRINEYGHQSSCVDSAELRKFCFCNEN